MKLFKPLVVLLLALAVTLSSPTAIAQTGLRIEQWTTPAGAKVLFVRSPSIPMLDLNIDFDAGSRYDPPEKAGLASLAVGMLAKGVNPVGSNSSGGIPAGGKALSEADIAQGYAMLGAQRGGGASDDRSSVNLRTLTSETELAEAINLTAQILAYPSYPEAVLEREKARLLSALKEAETKPETIVQRTFSQLAYGKHPYGLDATPASVNAIQSADLRAFHSQYFRADRATVSMIGAITRAQAQAIADQLTRALPKGATPVSSFAAITRPEQAIVRRIEHPANQSHILIGAPAIARGDPDFFALLVGNYVLGGGGFVSRLYNDVREQRGLAYSVYSGFSPSRDAGPFTIGLQTQRERTNEALAVVRETLGKFLEGGPTATELADAKSNLIGGFPLRIDSNRKILDNLAVIGYYGLPLDYLDTWSGKISAVTLEAVREAFKRHVSLERLITVVVGAGS